MKEKKIRKGFLTFSFVKVQIVIKCIIFNTKPAIEEVESQVIGDMKSVKIIR